MSYANPTVPSILRTRDIALRDASATVIHTRCSLRNVIQLLSTHTLTHTHTHTHMHPLSSYAITRAMTSALRDSPPNSYAMSYAAATRCPVLTSVMLLPGAYAVARRRLGPMLCPCETHGTDIQ
eukprot:141021-Rhodomonas_salina.1